MSSIYPVTIKNETKYRVYFLYKNQKINLGTYFSLATAKSALNEAKCITKAAAGVPVFDNTTLDFKKVVCLCNLRDHHTYIKNPIYLFPTYFSYYLSKDIILLFDSKDLFYFSTYKIYRRNNYLYTQDSISQQNLLSRFGIQNHSVLGKDYYFKNQNPYDFRRENLVIINSYKGVSAKKQGDDTFYVTSIYTTNNIVVGHYKTEIEAAIAYNKAIDLLKKQGYDKQYISNDLAYLTRAEYQQIYDQLTISSRLNEPNNMRKRIISQKLYRGICKDKNSFKVHIGYQGKQLYLGMYSTEKRAAQAYNYASFYLFGRNGYINDVNPVIHDGDMEKIAKCLSKYHINKRANSLNDKG